MSTPATASNDSTEEQATGAAPAAGVAESQRIAAASGDFPNAANMSINSSSRSHLPISPSGHLEPKRRRTYLVVFGLALSSALVGLVLVVVWMMSMRPVSGVGLSDGERMANLHPIMMFTFMVSLNMYAVLVYRTHFKLAKSRLKWIHAILSGGNIVMSLLGVLAMFKAHLLTGKPNFYSLHSWIGLLTNGFYLAQFVLGFVSFLRPGLAQHKRAALMPWHRLAGSSILVLAAFAAVTGIGELVIFQDSSKAYGAFKPITFVANFAGVSVLLMTAATIYLLTAPQYLRPSLPEEEPLKR